MSEPVEKRLDATIGTTCGTCPGSRGFCNLGMSKIGGQIVLDPHVAGSCVIWLDEDEARAMRDQLTEWLG